MNMPGPKKGYTCLADEAITDKLTKERADQKEGLTQGYFPLRPSSAGHCSKKIGYDLMEFLGKGKYEKEIYKPNTHRLLNFGHSVEFSAIKNLDLIKDIKIIYKQQTVTLFRLDPVDGKEQRLVEGSCDGVFWSDKHKAVFDIKSQKDGFSVAYRSRWDQTLEKYEESEFIDKIGDNAFYINDLDGYIEQLGDDWLVDNLVQLNSYACSDFFVERGIDHAVIYKYNKNDSRHYELRFKPSHDLFDALKIKYNKINKAVVKDEFHKVSKDFVLGSMRCAFCNYNKECWGGEDARKEWTNKFSKREPDDLTKLSKHISDPLLEGFKKWIELEGVSASQNKVEKDIVKIMVQNQIERVKLPNNKVFKAKYLKTYGGFVLRKDKL